MKMKSVEDQVGTNSFILLNHFSCLSLACCSPRVLQCFAPINCSVNFTLCTALPLFSIPWLAPRQLDYLSFNMSHVESAHLHLHLSPCSLYIRFHQWVQHCTFPGVRLGRNLVDLNFSLIKAAMCRICQFQIWCRPSVSFWIIYLTISKSHQLEFMVWCHQGLVLPVQAEISQQMLHCLWFRPAIIWGSLAYKRF